MPAEVCSIDLTSSLQVHQTEQDGRIHILATPDTSPVTGRAGNRSHNMPGEKLSSQQTVHSQRLGLVYTNYSTCVQLSVSGISKPKFINLWWIWDLKEMQSSQLQAGKTFNAEELERNLKWTCWISVPTWLHTRNSKGPILSCTAGHREWGYQVITLCQTASWEKPRNMNAIYQPGKEVSEEYLLGIIVQYLTGDCIIYLQVKQKS